MAPKKPFSFTSLSKPLLLFALILRLGFLFKEYLPLYQSGFDSKEATNRYYQSSYIRGDKSDLTLSDSELYATEGYFLIHNHQDLEQLTPGHPPLGKYLIGLSIAIFNTPYIASFIGFLAVLFYVFLLTKSLALTLIISFEPLLVSQLNTSLLDLYLISFHLLSLYFFRRFYFDSPKIGFICLSSFFIGLSFATKFFPVTMPLLALYFALTVFGGKFELFRRFVISLAFIPLGFAFGHLSYFFYHPSLIQFAKYFRYVLNWWAGSPQVPPFSVWPMIFTNHWSTWWGQGIIPAPDWWIGWPIAVGFGLVISFSKSRFWLWLYLCFSLIFLSFQAIFPRHLITILPIAYFLAFTNLKTWIQGIIYKIWPPA